MDSIWYPQLDLPAGVKIAQTTRIGGSSRSPWDGLNLGLNTGDDAETVLRNRYWLQQQLDSGVSIHWLRQVHGDRLVEATGSAASEPVEADAIFSRQPLQACAVLTADCVPVLLYAQDGSCCGAVHAGWRGLEGRILEKSCEQLQQATPFSAWIGPCIRQQAYEVDDKLVQQLDRAETPGLWQCVCLSEKAGHYLLDLAGLAIAQLRNAGIGEIVDSGICTASDKRLWYSHRRDQVSGRQASLIWLAPPV